MDHDHFPMRIKVGEQTYLIFGAYQLPQGTPFTVLETSVNQELTLNKDKWYYLGKMNISLESDDCLIIQNNENKRLISVHVENETFVVKA